MTPTQNFYDECEDVRTLLADCDDGVFSLETKFKAWTVYDILAHLHVWNIAADLSLSDPKAFTAFIDRAGPVLAGAETHQDFQNRELSYPAGPALFGIWQAYYQDMSARCKTLDPNRRVKWAGPDMSAGACLIARQMEHWAHAQAIYDVLGKTRINTDRIKSIAHLGVLTYSWSFRVRGAVPPLPKPYVRLVAPSGAVWTWNDPQTDNRIEGRAEAFCQVVTQCRNIGDTDLLLAGDIAAAWMSVAQCFAGPPETPPAKGARQKSIS